VKNLVTVKSKIVDNAQIFNIRSPISLERLKLESTRSYFDGMQELGQRRHDLV